ncbi:MAG: DNA polymerase III subunit gamma/tau [Chlamydiae bacterium]|nr:DNA polymerase III subunit gamma/tau [Chlamydiota bacterium]
MPQLEKLPDNLKKLLQSPPNALLFKGPKGSHKREFARTFARELLKSEKKEPPDLRELFPEGKAHMHPIRVIREFIRESEKPPFEAECKIFLIHEADRMLPASMNALLKTLEEPLSTTIIILISSHPRALLPTLTSRCFTLSFTPNSDGKEENLSEKIFDLGCALIYREYPDLKEYDELEDIEEALSYLFYFYRDLHLLKVGADPSLLFYQGREEALRKCLECSIPSLESLQHKIDQINLSGELHIPLSHSLSTLF